MTFSHDGQDVFEPEMRSDPGKLLRANALAASLDGGDAEAVALGAWSLVHGIAMLVLDEQIIYNESMVDRILQSISVAN